MDSSSDIVGVGVGQPLHQHVRLRDSRATGGAPGHSQVMSHNRDSLECSQGLLRSCECFCSDTEKAVQSSQGCCRVENKCPVCRSVHSQRCGSSPVEQSPRRQPMPLVRVLSFSRSWQTSTANLQRRLRRNPMPSARRSRNGSRNWRSVRS